MRHSFDLTGYLASRGIPYSMEGKNVSQGWLGTKCPYCSDKSNHLGINLSGMGFSCFKCGETGTVLKLIATLEPGGWAIAKKVMAEFSSQELKTHIREDFHAMGQFVPPTGANAPLTPAAIGYLRRERGFAYRMLEKKYLIKCFRPTSLYRCRIYIPVLFNGRLVTFTTRSYVKKLEPKYLHFPKRTSLMFAKETLYNVDNAGDTAVVVEGPTDVWRIGDGAVATFGVVYTQKQIKLIRERFKRVFIMFDAEPQAQEQAQRLADDLACFNMEVNKVNLSTGDPGKMKTEDVKHLRKEIFGR